MALPDRTAFVALVHLRAGTLRVAAGETVVQGQQLATCGNSGNSTQPHLHIQAMDSADLSVARGVPMTFRSFREWPRGATNARFREWGMPGEASVIEPLAS
ncbi:M23 family metallopeptidase [Leifsonia poae]|uniref:M23 family metallopeptidase n=1 Tax=Leifsonia poae TaxID=110933 RepID=UPI003D674B4F